MSEPVDTPPVPQAAAAEGTTTLNLRGEKSYFWGEAEVHRKNMQSGARWFYWIAGLSLINAIAATTNSTWSFLAGFGITQFISGFASGLSADLGEISAVMIIAFILNVLVAGFFVFLGEGSYVGLHRGGGGLCAGRTDLFGGPTLVPARFPRFRFLLSLSGIGGESEADNIGS